MRNMLAIVLLCLLSLSLAAGQQASTTSGVEDQITKLEQGWAQATIKDGVAAVDQYEADDIMSTDPSGRVTDKAQDKKDLSSGDLKFQSIELSDLKIRVYGNTAVVTGTETLKGTYKEQDISGKYRYTDIWAKRNGKWQAVGSQATKVQQ
jgi:ketosteroid isomerase-like protein